MPNLLNINIFFNEFQGEISMLSIIRLVCFHANLS